MRSHQEILAIGLIALTATSLCYATAQSGDILLQNGDKHFIFTYPLEPLLLQHPEMRPDSNIYSTGLWRGYIATWEFSDDHFYLTDLRIKRKTPGTQTFETEMYSVLSDVFPGKARIAADWYSGYIVVPQGELLEYVHMGCASTYENYSIFTVIAGELVHTRELTSRQFTKFRKRQFNAWRKTEGYLASVANVLDDGESEPDVREFLFEADSCEFTSTIFDSDE